MTQKQKELLDDEILRCSPLTRQKIADVIREYDTKITELKIELEQEQVISNGLESVVKDFEMLIDKIDNITDNAEIKNMIKMFKDEHEG